MINRSLVLGACLAAVALLNDRSATAQQPKPLPANAVIANPVPGELAYSISCKGKVQLQIDDYTVTGDSISSDKGKLTLTNAVVKSDKATLTSEKMQIHLPIFSVRVESNSAEPNGSGDSLEPIPDAMDVPLAFPNSARLQSNYLRLNYEHLNKAHAE